MMQPYCPAGKTVVNTNISAEPKLRDSAPGEEAYGWRLLTVPARLRHAFPL
jgi:hypothetical protein